MTLPAYESTGAAWNGIPADVGGEAVRRSRTWAWLVVPAAAGILLGIAWWLLAPGGANLLTRDPALGDPSTPLTRLPRDLVLAALLLLAGCFTAVLLDSSRPEQGRALRTFLAAAGGLAGSAAAWQVGLLAAGWWGPTGAVPAGEDGFTLRSAVVLIVWPFTVALLAFLYNLFSLLGRGTRTGDQAH
ncbi:hypothetical protein [Arthrobacter celericrescens]|uniref:hypothetical protein n=1 Tax=Arthrobacter celericrescens TaxID=2320851 RepID=UPI001FE14035|nr:hypothetical protein [Arthrobacter celericrescens]